MKTLVMVNQKGGVGKSAITVQFAYYCAALLNKRVLVIDFDHQRNTSKAIKLSGLAVVSNVTASQVLTNEVKTIEASDFVLISGDTDLIQIEKKGSEAHNRFANNFHKFVQSVSDKFDICIIDTNPNPDIRQLASLVVADFALSPVQLNQEALDGIAGLLNHESIGIRKIKATINPKLELIGILPNLVEPTPFQRENFKQLAADFSKLLVPVDGRGYASIKKSTAIPESQSKGIPVWKLKKTSATEAWKNIQPVFAQIAKTIMGVNNNA